MHDYNYTQEKSKLFTEDGQVPFLSIRDHVQKLLKLSGAVRMDYATENQTGDSWVMMACVDRLLELGGITEITQHGVVDQHRIFMDARR